MSEPTENQAKNVALLATKLNHARKLFHQKVLKKSGHNKFAGYNYFELSDFLPAALSAFGEAGLCGVISFDPNFATMTVIDTVTGNTHLITSPMAEAALKGANPIQNLGAAQTYQRRYLWMAALEIIEQDAVDTSGATSVLTPPQAKVPDKVVPMKPHEKLTVVKKPVFEAEKPDLQGEAIIPEPYEVLIVLLDQAGIKTDEFISALKTLGSVKPEVKVLADIPLNDVDKFCVKFDEIKEVIIQLR